MILRWSIVVAAMGFLACDGVVSQPPTGPKVDPPPVELPSEPIAPDGYTISIPDGPLLAQPDRFEATIAVNALETHQTMDGFGASMRIFSDPHLIDATGGIENSLQIDSAQQDAVLRMLYHDIGLTRVRPIYQANLSQPSRSDIPRRDWVFGDGHIDIVKRAATMGLKETWLSPFMLESWMNQDMVSDYVEWAFANIKYWRSKGVELPYFSIVNEPNVRQITGEFLREAVRVLGKRLRAEGFQTKLVIPDDINPRVAAEKAALVLADPDSRPFVGAIATHLYDYPVSEMSDVSALARQYGIPLWMSEYYVADRSPVTWAKLVGELIGVYDVAAVDYMWGFFGDQEATSLVLVEHTGGRFVRAGISGPGYAMAQYARYVRPGAVRVGVVSSESGLRVTAFVRNGKLTLVLVNERETPVKTRISVAGVAGLTRLSLVRTSATEQVSGVGRFDITGNALNVELPAQSISTLIQ